MELKGYILLARKTMESEIWMKPPEWFKIWVFILLRASYEDGLFPRGTNFINWEMVKSSIPHITKSQYNKCINYLKRGNQITTRKTTRGNVITVVNYGKYQSMKNYGGTQKDTQEGKSKANGRHTISKELKNERIYTKPPSAKAVSGFKDIKQLLDSPHKHLELIGYYLQSTGKKFNTPEELTVTVKRWMRDASAIAKFSEDKINDAFEDAKKKYPDIWHLGTVLKILTK